MTLNQVIQRIKNIALAHKQIRNFYEGLVGDYLSDKTTLYASAFLQCNGGKISTSGHATTLNYRLFLLDLVHASEGTKGNEQDVQSDMLSVAMDVIAQMNNGNYSDWLLSTDNNIQLVVENENDVIAGCMVDFSLRINFTQNICQIPTTLTDYTTIDNDMKTVEDIAYIATGAEGTVIVVPEVVGKKILLVVREGNIIYPVGNLPDSVQYVFDGNTITLGTASVAGQRFLILYRNL